MLIIDTMKTINNKELKEIIQSGHINLLIGSGCSCDFITTLGDIEERMNNDQTKFNALKEYYTLIKKSKAILCVKHEINSTERTELAKTKENYDSFLDFWASIISSRSLHIVNKQVNIFTTNFDMFVEDSCERLNIPYNDGFTGQINPFFSVKNFNKILKYKSMQFDNTSDIPLFNIVKLHGSISWLAKDDKIMYSNGSHIPDDLESKTEEEFQEGYKKIAVINPNAEKHFETVLDTNFASMLRKFALELEKENSVLFIMGFSLNDKHIKDLLYGAMKSNPTLVVVYFSYETYNKSKDDLQEQANPNLYVISSIVCKEKLDRIFGTEDTWKEYVKDLKDTPLELIDDIEEKIESPEKDKLVQLRLMPFNEIIEYLKKIFICSEDCIADAKRE